MKTPMSKAVVKQHFTYNWWKYLLLILLACFGWNLIYTTTAYRPPAEKKVEFYVLSGGASQDALNTYLENVRQTEMSDMELMDAVLLTTDQYYGSVQLSTYIMAGEGDVYLLDKSNFQSYASNGGMLPLEDVPEVMANAEAAGAALDKGYRTDTESGEKHLFGIPAATLTGLNDYGIDVSDMYLCVTVNNGNDENSMKLLAILLRDMMQK